MMSSADQTAMTPKRIGTLDALRGFALLGILVVNITVFASAFTDRGIADPAFNSTLDDAVRFAIHLLFESKFYLLFSFIFGYSFTLQIESAKRRNVSFTARFLRRMLGLAAIGSFHAIFLWHYDILTTYAVFGVILLAMHRFSPRKAVKVAAGIMIVMALLLALLGLAVLASPDLSPQDPSLTSEAIAATVQYQGSFFDVMAQRLSELPLALGSVLLIQGPTALAMFLVGLAAGKLQLLANIEQYHQQLRRVMVAGFAVGLTGALLYATVNSFAVGDGVLLLSFAIDVLTAPFLTAAYVATFVLAIQTRHGFKIGQILQPIGRMALSNYILQSLVCGLIFTGYGFGLIGSVSPLGALMFALLIFCTQIMLSSWWLDRHLYGPLEWLLRALTNWELPAWRSTPHALTT